MKKLITILMLLILTTSVFGQVNINIQELVSKKSVFGSFFSIVLDQSTYERGEIVHAQDYQNINTYCEILETQMLVRDDSGNTLGQASKLSYNDGWTTAYMSAQFSTANLANGEYEILVFWVCDSVILGQDGYPDNNIQPSSQTFKVTWNLPIIEPDQECSKSCNAGYRLVNQDSVDCYCEPAWDDNNDECEIGEPVTTPDCSPIQDDPYNPDNQGGDYTLIFGGIIGLLAIFLIGMFILNK